MWCEDGSKDSHVPTHEIKDEAKSKKPSAYWDINCMHLVFNHAGEEALR